MNKQYSPHTLKVYDRASDSTRLSALLSNLLWVCAFLHSCVMDCTNKNAIAAGNDGVLISDAA